MRGAGLWLLVILTLVPSVHASKITVEEGAQVGLDKIRWVQEWEFREGLARDLRHHLDTFHGDRDGRVDEAEVARFSREHELTFSSMPSRCFEHILGGWLDERRPNHYESERQSVELAAGPISSEAPLRLRIEREFHYPRPANETVRASIQFSNADTWFPSGCIQAHGVYPRNSSHYLDHSTWEHVTAENLEQDPPVIPYAWIRPMPGVAFDRASLSPQRHQHLWDIDGWRDDAEHRGVLFTMTRHNFTIRPYTAPAANPGPDLEILRWSPTLVVPALGFLAWRVELLRMGLVRLLGGLLLASRSQEHDHPRRAMLRQRIREAPGLCFSELREVTEIANGALLHHLRALERTGDIKPVRDGMRVRYYPRVAGAVYSVPATPEQQRIDAVVRARPGINQRELASMLGWNRLAVHRRSKHMIRSGRLRAERQGRMVQYFPGAPRTLEAPPVYGQVEG